MHIRGSTPDYATLARRISTYTTNLLATAIILVLGLALGWQILAWWQGEPPATLAAVAPQHQTDLIREFQTTRGPLRIERVTGGQDQALAAMRSSCRAATASPASGSVGPAEQRLLQQLQSQTAVETSDNLAFYQPPGEGLMVAAVSRDNQRIVAWSLAVAAEQGGWSIYHFQPTSRAAP